MPLGDPAIWECSRFCIDHKLAARSEDSIAPKLLIALCEWALSHDVQFILGSFDLSMDRIYKRIGWRPSVYARSKSDPRHIVGLWDATPAHLRLMCSKIEASVNEKLIAEFTIRNAEDDLWVKERGLA
jgi:acyl homoserine lactone synthase